MSLLTRTAALLLAVAALAAPAAAQIGQLAGFTESMQREYLSRDLRIISDELVLDQAQRDILENLYEDYKSDFAAGLEAMQQRLRGMKDELQTDDRQRVLNMIFVPFEEWNEERGKLGESFLESIRLVLNEDQQARWPAFERQLRRQKELDDGQLAGENVDLIVLVRNLDLPQPVSLTLEPVLNDYELALDNALRHRTSVLSRTQREIVQAIRDTEPERTVRLVDEQLQARVQVRQVNDRYIDLLTAALPGEYSDTFRAIALERAYPKAYRTTPGQRMFEAALRLDEIDAETRQSLQDLYDAFQSEMQAISARVVELIREHEPAQERNRVEIYAARMSGGAPGKLPDPSLTELRNRDRLDDRYIAVLRGVLSDELFRKLPGGDRWVEHRNRIKERNAEVSPHRPSNGGGESKQERPTRGDSKGIANPPN